MYGRREIGNETISWWSNGRAAVDNMESESAEDGEIGRKIRRGWEGMVWEWVEGGRTVFSGGITKICRRIQYIAVFLPCNKTFARGFVNLRLCR